MVPANAADDKDEDEDEDEDAGGCSGEATVTALAARATNADTHADDT